MVADQFRIARVPLDSDRARDLLSSYYAELDARFPEGFDPERPVSAPGGELEPPSGAFLVVYIDGAIALYRSAGYRDIAPYNDNLYAGRWFEKRLT